MYSYSALLVVLFGTTSCVKCNDLANVPNNIATKSSDYSLQVSKGNLTCHYNDVLINCSHIPYLLDSSEYKYDRRLFNGHPFKKPTRLVLPQVRIPRPPFSLKGRLDRPDKFYNIPQTVTRPYIINKNIRNKNNNNLFPFKHKHYYYDSTISLPTMKNAIKQSRNNLILSEKDRVDTTASRAAAAKYTINFIENKTSNDFFFELFKRSLERFNSKFYQATFTKLRSISPSNRSENAISFVQSGLLLYIALMAISTEVDPITKLEIDACLMYPSSVMEKIKLLEYVLTWLPVSNNHLKFRWTSRLALEEGLRVSPGFVGGIANRSKLHVEQFNNTDTKDNVFDTLNHMVETDSDSAMRDTFKEDDFSEGFCSVFINTLYIRARWRVAPTVLNETYPFKDGTGPGRSVRMIKLNDMMGYTELMEWDAEAIEIKYASRGLTLLMVVPRGNSIRNVIDYMKTTTPQEISNKMHDVRVAATLPIYTLRMTLLLPGKLQVMNISRLMDAKLGNNSKCGQLRLSHAVQRLMFWAEAGRYAFKDDGIEWDEAPDVKLMADRPYLFYVRWKNVTVMNGNFVL